MCINAKTHRSRRLSLRHHVAKRPSIALTSKSSFSTFNPASHLRSLQDLNLDTLLNTQFYKNEEFDFGEMVSSSPSLPQLPAIVSCYDDTFKSPVDGPSHLGYTAKNRLRHFVKHNYHDHSNDMPTDAVPEEHHIAAMNTSDGVRCCKTMSKNTRKKSNPQDTFPMKLHRMLFAVEVAGDDHIISWQPHGRSFVIHKPRMFVAEVLPKFFNQSKLTSFQRQLNLYGFERLTRGNDAGGYYHELFLRGREFLVSRMTRTRIKGTGFKAASSPETEPNFYEMPYVVDSKIGSNGPMLLHQANCTLDTGLGNLTTADWSYMVSLITDSDEQSSISSTDDSCCSSSNSGVCQDGFCNYEIEAAMISLLE